MSSLALESSVADRMQWNGIRWGGKKSGQRWKAETLGPKPLREGLGTPGLSAFLGDGTEVRKGISSVVFRSERLFRFPLVSIC